MKKLRITGRHRRRFLEALAETGNVTLAARAAGISRARVYELRGLDPAFAAAWEDAEQIAADRLEAEARRRGVDGVPEPVVSGGRHVVGEDGNPLYVQKYSDPLLLALLRAHRPEKFQERHDHKLTGTLTLAMLVEQAHQLIADKLGGKVIDGTADNVSASTQPDALGSKPNDDPTHT